MKKMILTLSILICCLCIITGCGKKNDKGIKQDNNTPVVKENTNENVIKDQTVSGIEFTNTSLKIVDGMSTIVTKITNNTNGEYTKDSFTIIIKDNNGKVIQEIPGYINRSIPVGESLVISSGVDVDLSNAYSVEYKVEE